MKKLLFALIMCAATVVALAQDPASTATPQPAQTPSTEMQPIAASDLPAAVTASLQGQDYSGWTVSNAFKKEKDGKTIYKVELKNGAETKTVKFDADGNMLKAKDKEKEKSVQ
jgi:phosphate-selective porin